MKLPKEESIHYPILLCIVMTGLSVTRAPSLVLLGMGHNSLWVFVPCLLSVWLGIWLIHRVTSRVHPSLMATTAQLSGKFVQKLLYLCYGMLFLGGTVYYTYLSGDFVSKTLINGNLRYYVMLETALATCIAFFPVKVHARYAHIMWIFVLPFFLFISLAPILHARWEWAMPVWNKEEMWSPLYAFSSAMLVFLPLAAIAMLQNEKRKLSGLSIGVLSLLIALLTTYFMAVGIATFGIQRATQIIYLTYSVMNTVRIENLVLERIVFIWILYWKFMQFIGSAFLLRCAAYSFASLLNLRVTPVVVIAAGMTVALAEWFGTSPFLARNLSIPLGLTTYALVVVVPGLLYILSKLRRKPE